MEMHERLSSHRSLALLLVPGVTVLLPLVQLIKALGLPGRNATQISTYAGLAFPMINGAGPLAIFLFRNYFTKLPDELRDAARVDGCSVFGIYMRIFLPLSLPVITTVSILNFITTWNAYIWPSIVVNNDDWFTLPLKLKDLDLQTVVQWNVRYGRLADYDDSNHYCLPATATLLCPRRNCWLDQRVTSSCYWVDTLSLTLSGLLRDKRTYLSVLSEIRPFYLQSCYK